MVWRGEGRRLQTLFWALGRIAEYGKNDDLRDIYRDAERRIPETVLTREEAKDLLRGNKTLTLPQGQIRASVDGQTSRQDFLPLHRQARDILPGKIYHTTHASYAVTQKSNRNRGRSRLEPDFLWKSRVSPVLCYRTGRTRYLRTLRGRMKMNDDKNA